MSNERLLRIVAAITVAIGSTASAEAKDVLIRSSPPGAQVVVDGRPLGRTPLQTTRKELMPNWVFDGLPTKATIVVELPLYEPKSVVVSEYGIPPVIDFTLEKKPGAEHVENYLAELPELEATTIASSNHVLHVSDDMDQESGSLFANGYVLVGYLGYAAEIVPIDAIREKAREAGAAVVLVHSRFGGVQTELRQVTSRTSGSVATTVAFGSSSAVGGGSFQAQSTSPWVGGVSGGWSSWASGSSSATSFSFIPGRTTTQFVPFSKRQYDTQATLWRKRVPNALGVYSEPLPQPVRQALQRNTGAFVIAIEDDSPAFLANILAGDVLVSVAGRPVHRPADVGEIASSVRGEIVEVEVLRPSGPVKLQAEIK